jgi:hypothetical protein
MTTLNRRGFVVGALGTGVISSLAWSQRGRSGADRSSIGRYLMATESPTYDTRTALWVESDSVSAGERVVIRGRLLMSGRLCLRRVGWSHDHPIGPAVMATDVTATGEDVDDYRSWPVLAEVVVDSSWRSGLYLAEFGDGEQRRCAPFVVRAATGAPVTVHIPFFTYQAYNGWGGASLYPFNSPNGRADTIDRWRPFDVFDGAGFAFYGDVTFARWLDRCGFDANFITSGDLHDRPEALDKRSLFVSVFHDEYWSTAMRNRLDAHVATGGNAAFLGANSIYWRIRVDDQSITCLKASKPDDDPHPEPTGTWRGPLVRRSEAILLGSAYESFDFPYGFGHPFTIADDAHWLFRDTGLRTGDQLPGAVGYEWDRAPDVLPDGVEVVASTRFDDRNGKPRRHDATVKTHPSGGIVVNMGTTYWPRLLSPDPLFGSHDAVGVITGNLIRRLARLTR